MLNLHALRLFYTVAQTGSVTRASQVLNISKPAISAQIRKFEKENDIVLFEIRGRQLALTELGRQLIQPLDKLFALEAHVQELIKDHHHSPHGKLRIIGNFLATSLLIPKWAALFKQQFPQVKVQIATVNSREALEKMLNFEADAAIYGLADMPLPAADGLRWTELYQDEFWFVVAAGHKFAGREVTLSEMLTEPFIMREEGSVTRDRLIQLCKDQQLPPPNIELQFNGFSGAIQAVIAGYGATFISSLVVDGYVARGELAKVKVTGSHLENTIVLCTRLQEFPEPLVQAFSAVAVQNKAISGRLQ